MCCVACVGCCVLQEGALHSSCCVLLVTLLSKQRLTCVASPARQLQPLASLAPGVLYACVRVASHTTQLQLVAVVAQVVFVWCLCF